MIRGGARDLGPREKKPYRAPFRHLDHHDIMDPYNTVILLLCGSMRFAWSIIRERTLFSSCVFK